MSYGRGTLFHVMQEQVDGITQAAMVKFPLKFSTGLMRGRVNPKDGQVYVCGVRGWQTDGTKDGGFYRVRYTGKAPSGGGSGRAATTPPAQSGRLESLPELDEFLHDLEHVTFGDFVDHAVQLQPKAT